MQKNRSAFVSLANKDYSEISSLCNTGVVGIEDGRIAFLNLGHRETLTSHCLFALVQLAM